MIVGLRAAHNGHDGGSRGESSLLQVEPLFLSLHTHSLTFTPGLSMYIVLTHTLLLPVTHTFSSIHALFCVPQTHLNPLSLFHAGRQVGTHAIALCTQIHLPFWFTIIAFSSKMSIRKKRKKLARFRKEEWEGCNTRTRQSQVVAHLHL